MKFFILLTQSMLWLLAGITLFVFLIDARFETLGFFIFGTGLSLLLIWILNKIKRKRNTNNYIARFLLYLGYLMLFAGLHQLSIYFIFNKGNLIYSLAFTGASICILLIGISKKQTLQHFGSKQD